MAPRTWYHAWDGHSGTTKMPFARSRQILSRTSGSFENGGFAHKISDDQSSLKASSQCLGKHLFFSDAKASTVGVKPENETILSLMVSVTVYDSVRIFVLRTCSAAPEISLSPLMAVSSNSPQSVFP